PAGVRSRRAIAPARHHRAVLASAGRVPPCRRGARPEARESGRDGDPRPVDRRRWPLRAHFQGPAGGRGRFDARSSALASPARARERGVGRARWVGGPLLGLLTPWRARVVVIGALVLAAALFELVPPLVIRNIVDTHFRAGNPDGLLV